MQKPKLSRDCRVYNLNKCVVPTSASGSSCYDTLGRIKRSWDLCFSDLFPDSFDMARGYLTPVYPQLSLHACLPSWVFSLSSPTKYNDNPLLQTKDFFFLVHNQTLIPTALCWSNLRYIFIVLLTPTISTALFVWPHNITHPTLFPLFAGSVMLGFSLLFLPLTRWPLLPCFLPSDPKSLNLPLSFFPNPAHPWAARKQSVSSGSVCPSIASLLFSPFSISLWATLYHCYGSTFPFVLVRIPWKDYLSLNSSSFTLLFKSPFPYFF